MALSRQHELNDTCWRSSEVSAGFVSPEPDLTELLSSSCSSNSSSNSIESAVCVTAPVPCVTAAAPCSISIAKCAAGLSSTSSNPASIMSPSAICLNTVFGNKERKHTGFKPNSSTVFEHSVKGGKTAKRGKTNSKFKILTFSDIEGSLSFLDRSSSSWTETASDKAVGRQPHRDQRLEGDSAYVRPKTLYFSIKMVNSFVLYWKSLPLQGEQLTLKE